MATTEGPRRKAKRSGEASSVPRTRRAASPRPSAERAGGGRRKAGDRSEEDNPFLEAGGTGAADEGDGTLLPGERVGADAAESIPAPGDEPGSGAGPLAPYDPLGAYLREINRYALLTHEQETEAAVRYFRTQDVDAAARLVTANLRLVVKIAFEYRRAYRNVMDLIQEGNIGLMQAVKKFDPFRGVKLSTYASWWIRAYILRYLLNNWRLVKIGTTQAQRRLFFNLSKEKRRLEMLGIDPTPQKIAEGLSVTPKEVIEMDRRLGSPEFSLDAPARGSGAHSEDGQASARVDFLSSEDTPADELLALSQFNETLHRRVADFAATLTGRDADVFRTRLWADKPETLQEIGDRYGLTREGVRQVEKRVLARLRQYLEETMGEYLDFAE